jgi:replicative DNA helicase
MADSICEVNVVKNRTGPTKPVELAFLRQFTRFENLASSEAQRQGAGGY